MTKNSINYISYILLLSSTIQLFSAAMIDPKETNQKETSEIDSELIIVAGEGNKAEIERLIKKGVNVNAANKFGYTALMRATKYGHKYIVELLLKAGANVNATNNYGDTALMRAAEFGKKDIVEILLYAGAEDYVDSDGYTALILAIVHGHRDITELLLKSGCDFESMNKVGKKAIDYARESDKPEMVALIIEEPSRRKRMVKFWSNWIASVIANTKETTGLIIQLADIIAQYTQAYRELPIEFRLPKKIESKSTCIIC